MIDMYIQGKISQWTPPRSTNIEKPLTNKIISDLRFFFVVQLRQIYIDNANVLSSETHPFSPFSSCL